MLVGHASRPLFSSPSRIFCWFRLISDAVVADAPRRRGRPRRVVDEELPRPRGRPRKGVDEKPPRPRGRPRKQADGETPRTRGRPRKVVDQQPPRPRGRPKVVLRQPPKSHVDDEHPKRRGRPRKNASEEPGRGVLSEPGEANGETKGPVGRPRLPIDPIQSRLLRRRSSQPALTNKRDFATWKETQGVSLGDSQQSAVGKGKGFSGDVLDSSNNNKKGGLMKGLRDIFSPEDQSFNYPQGLDNLLQHPAAPSHKAPSQHPPESKIELPPLSEWKNIFSASNYGKILARDRIAIRDPTSALQVANKFVPAGSSNKVIIEAFPGPGALTRAFLQLPQKRFRRLIVLEDWPQFLEYLKPLEKIDPRVHVIPMRGFNWDTYHTLEDLGLLEDIQKHSWDDIHPELTFVSHLEQNVFGEQLIAQFFRSISEKTWLFKYGRVPMNFVMSDKTLERLSAEPRHRARGKLAVIAAASAAIKMVVPSSKFRPDVDFWPPISEHSFYGHKSICSAVTITPHKDQIITSDMVDKWDYCLRRLFTLKSTPLGGAIHNLGPGAESLLRSLDDPAAPASKQLRHKDIRLLEVKDWERLVQAFDDWPFAPETLLVNDSEPRRNRR